MKRTKAPTIKDVAAEAEVSIGTVSAVIHGKSTVNAAIRRRVEEAIARIGYSPNAVAQSMRLGSTRTVGIVIRDISLPFVAAFVSASQDVFYDAGYATLVASFGNRRDREIDLIKVLSGRKVDGILVSTHPEGDPEIDALLRQTGYPVVLVERELPEWADAVLVNHRDAIRRATEYLLRLGHKRIAILVGDTMLYPSRERITGYEEAHRALGVPIDPSLMKTESTLADYGWRQTLSLVARAHPPTAMIAGGPLLSGVLRGLASKRIRIPEDISVVATSNSDLAELIMPPISTERWDAAEVGTAAARLLLQRMPENQLSEIRRVMIPAEFSLRDSCAPPPNA